MGHLGLGSGGLLVGLGTGQVAFPRTTIEHRPVQTQGNSACECPSMLPGNGLLEPVQELSARRGGAVQGGIEGRARFRDCRVGGGISATCWSRSGRWARARSIA